MRRFLFWLTMLQGCFLPSALLAATRPTHASAHHAHSATKPRTGSAHKVYPKAVRRAQRKSAHVAVVHAEMTELIDPVPLGRFTTPLPLKGSHESLLRQNVRSQQDGLMRIQNDADIAALRRSKDLVAIPASSALAVDERLPVNRRYTRPWTAQFLADLSQVHYRRFHRALQVNSAVRTVEYQRHLELVNGNAAPADGDDASPHLTGATIDIAKKGLSMDEIAWMRAYLMPLQAAGKIDVEEEFYQSCFHITVYRSYHPANPGIEAGAKPHHGDSAALLAAQVQ